MTLGVFDCQKLLSPLYRVVPGRHGGVTSACFPLTKPSQFHPGSEPPRTLGKAALWTEVDEPTEAQEIGEDMGEHRPANRPRPPGDPPMAQTDEESSSEKGCDATSSL